MMASFYKSIVSQWATLHPHWPCSLNHPNCATHVWEDCRHHKTSILQV